MHSSTVTTEQFRDQRRAGLAAQREATVARLTSLRHEIRKLMAQVEAGVISGDDAITAALDKVTRMGMVERKMVDDIARLNNKIGA